MKRFLLILCLLLFFTGNAWCLTINDASNTDVGFLDPFYAGSKTLANSGEDTEEAWIESLVGPVEYTQYDFVPTIYNVNELSTAYAFMLNDEPDYYLIKWGDGGDPDKDGPLQYVAWTLWTNQAKKNWAVFDTADSGLIADNWVIKNIDAFGHFGETGGTSVPEPTTLLLLGLGLVGMAGLRRKLR